jgi:chromosome segregation ATPase
MKKFLKIAGVTALSVVVLASCVKNEESDGVKNIRDAQAKLISAQADQALAEVQRIVEQVNGLKITNQTETYNAQLKELELKAKISSDTAELTNLARGQKLLAEQHKIDLLTAAADLERAKIKIIQAKLDLENSNDQVLKGYITTFDGLLLQIVNLDKQIALAQYNYDIYNHVDKDIIIAGYNRDIVDLNIDKKYLLMQVDYVKAAQAKFQSAVADPSTALTAAATANAEKEDIRKQLEAELIEVEKADKDQQDKSNKWNDASAAVTVIKQKINILAYNGYDNDIINGVLYKSIYTYEQDVIGLTNSNINLDLQLTGYKEQWTYWNAQLSIWKSKFNDLETIYDTKKAAYNTAYNNYSAAQAALNAAQQADNTYNTAETQTTLDNAQIAFNSAQNALTTANTEYQNAEGLYLNAQTQVASAQSGVNNFGSSITDTEKSIANNDNQITLYTNQKTAAVAELAALKGQLTTAVNTEEAARLAYVAAEVKYNELTAQRDLFDDQYDLLDALVDDLEDLAGNILQDAYDFEGDISDLNGEIEDIDGQIAAKTAQIENEKNGIKKTDSEKAADLDNIDGLNAKLKALQDELAHYAELIKAHKQTL